MKKQPQICRLVTAVMAAGILVCGIFGGNTHGGEIEPGNEIALYNASADYIGELYFPQGSQADFIRTQASAISKEQSKKIIRNRIDRWWDILINYIPFPSKETAYAFLLGHATLESTLNPALETAYTPGWCANPAHAYGLIQTAETAFSSTCPGWMIETVPDFPQAPLTENYFLDPVSSFDMGLRKLCWFSMQAQSEMRSRKPGFEGADLNDFRCSADFWMLMLKGFNTGWATYDVYENGEWSINTGWVDFYGTWVPATAKFYLYEDHLSDPEWTWHTDQRCISYLSDLYGWLCRIPVTVTVTRSATQTSTGIPTITRTVTQTNTVHNSPAFTPTATLGATQSVTSSPEPTSADTPVNTAISTSTRTLSGTPTGTHTITFSPSPAFTGTPTGSATASFTLAATDTVSSNTPTMPPDFTTTPTPAFSHTMSVTLTNGPAMTATLTATNSVTQSPTSTAATSPTFTMTVTLSAIPPHTLTPTASFTCTMTITDTVSSNTPIVTLTQTLTAVHTYTQSATPSATGTMTDTITVTPTPAPAAIQPGAPSDIQVYVLAAGDEPKQGAKVDYYIRIKNEGNTPAYNFAVWETLPANISFNVSRSSAVPVINGQYLYWDLGGFVLQPGEFIEIGFTANIDYVTPGNYIYTTAGVDFNDALYTETTGRHPPVFSTAHIYPESEIIVFPNPFNPNVGSGKLKFLNTPPGSMIKIYTVSGEIVWAVFTDYYREEWDGKNRHKKECAPGIYYYTVTGRENLVIRKGKIIVFGKL